MLSHMGSSLRKNEVLDIWHEFLDFDSEELNEEFKKYSMTT
jgi:hypothetical protein